MTVYSYAEQFERELQQKYARELTSYDLEKSNPQVKFMNAQTIKLPNITVSGYKDHNRSNMGFNAGTIANEWEPKKLAHDRDIEFAIDPMDIDESNLTLEMANIQNVFETEQAIPEKDSYRYSKLYSEAKTYTSNGAVVDTSTNLTINNILDWFDTQMEKMDDAGVPSEGRILYVTPSINKMIKQAEGITRSIDVNSNNGRIDRRIYSLDDVKIVKVPSGRMKTKYEFTNGCVAAHDAKQINIILIHPSCQVTRSKYSYIKVFTPGTDSRTADKYVFQNRSYGDTFLIKNKACGIAINAEAE
ncbi:capsid protein [Paraclostridium sordellii 8483]|uniref:capsid protein n=1 Tax=Paraclostridium sordellii TaxID=1505 RepID=UPI0002F561F0|nr:capsid protein [Paeniclostridium sordellii]TAN69157.1 capsid protein [Paeniclostridium sordellii 8483]